MGRADLERLSKDELIELVLRLQRQALFDPAHDTGAASQPRAAS